MLHWNIFACMGLEEL